MLQLINVRNPHAMLTPPMQELLQKMVDASPHMAPMGLGSIAEELMAFVERKDHWMIVAVEKGKFVGIVLFRLPDSNMFPYPTVTMLYNEGTRDASHALMERVMDTALESGYNSVWSHNFTGRSDAVFKRLITTPRGITHARSTLFEMELK